MNDEMPNPFAVRDGEYSTDEDNALTSTVDAIGELRHLARLVGFDIDEGLRHIAGERDSDLPRGPYTLKDLVMEVTGHAYATVDRVREAFDVPLPAYEAQAKPEMPEGGWPDPWGGSPAGT